MASTATAALGDEGVHAGPVRRRYETIEPASDNGLERLPDECGEGGIGIRDVAASRHDDGAVVHLFDKSPVRFFGAVQRVNLMAAGPLDDERIDLTMMNRAQYVLGFGKTHPLGRRLVGEIWFACDHGLFRPAGCADEVES